MKKIFKKINVRNLVVLLFVLGVVWSCGDDDFRIIPEPEQQHAIISIVPDFGDWGRIVTVNGRDFSPLPENNKVRFGELFASVLTATDTTLTVIVPDGATTGPILVSKAKFEVVSPVFTIIAAPQISELSSTGAAVGETILIKGRNFGPTIADNRVEFNGLEAEIIDASETEISVIVPDAATTGPLIVEVLGQIFEIETFTIAPVILSFQPLRGSADQQVTLIGTNFDRNRANNNVSFDNISATIISATNSQLIVLVPEEANSGKIAVEVEQLLGVSETDFITIPTIRSFSPNSGSVATEVIIEGFNFSSVPTENSIYFNGVQAVVTQSTPTKITTSVPEGANSGPITVEVNNEIVTSDIDFDFSENLMNITVVINDENNDVEEAADGRMTFTSSDLELGEFDTFGSPALGLQKIGLRFDEVNIPIGAIIQQVSMQLVADKVGSDPTEMTVFGENTGHALPYVNEIHNLSNRDLTMSNVVWNIPEWSVEGESGSDQRTPDLSPIVQEIINRNDWNEGNSMNFILEASGVSAGATSNNVGREAEAYSSDNPEYGAQLRISYLLN